MISAHAAFQIAGCLYALAFLGSFVSDKRILVRLLLIPAILANALVLFLRYQQAWPMLPMHLGPVALPLCLGLLFPFCASETDQHRPLVSRFMLGLAVFIVLMGLCFPKDFYLPFLKSKTLFAHAFLLFGVGGKGCFILSAVWAMAALPEIGRPFRKHLMVTAMNRSLLWAVWGFALWTVSMFSGEIWSYLGWGTPVVWEDAAITTTMAAWFFYACYLHLHLTRSWNPTGRAIYASLGGFAILAVTCLPDLGPFRALF